MFKDDDDLKRTFLEGILGIGTRNLVLILLLFSASCLSLQTATLLTLVPLRLRV